MTIDCVRFHFDSSKNAWDPSSSTSASNWKNSGPTGSVGGSSDWCGVVKASADVNNSAWSQSRTTQGENSQSVCSSSWSEIARKSINTAPPAQSNPIGSVINPAKDCNYEMGTGNWGKPVDQGTPWDVGNAGSSNNSNGGGNDPANAGGRRTDDESLVASSSWGSRPAAREPAWNTSNNSSDSSMIWNNPYPKKNTMPDKGTAIWGDPAAQGEIKRWKNSNEDANSVSTPPNPAPSTSAGAPSTSSKVAILPNAGSVWKDSPIAPQPVKPLNGWGTTGMNSPYGGLNATGALDASSSWMNDAAAAGGQVWNNDAASAKPGTSRQDVGNRRNVDSNLVGDDIFASHMIPGPSTNCDNSMQWKHGPLNPLNMYLSTDRKPIYINGGDCAAAISATASTSKQFGVFDMTAGSSSSDPWSNTKRQSGFEWPIDSFMKTGDMKDLRSSIFPSAAAAYGTLEDAVAAVVSQSDKNGIIGRHMSLDMSLASSMPGTSGAHTFGTGIIGIDDGPPEFRPGQKWEWRDPKEVADDPNATPGSVKTSSIGLGRFGHDLKPTYQAGPSTSGFAHGAYSMPSTSLLSAITTPTKSCIDPTISSISPNYATDSWSAKSFRPIMQTTTSSAAYSPFTATPITTAPQYASSSSSIPSTSCGLQWIVLMHLTQQTMDEQTLQYLFNRVGPVQAFVFPPGSGFAAVKFKDVSAEKAFARLQQDCSVYSNGLVIYIAKDNEVERLLQSTKNCQMFGPPGSLPPPPPGIVWDMPPPPPPNTQWTPAGPPHPFAPPPPPPPPGQMPLPEQLAAMGHPPNTVYGDTYYNMDSRHPTF
ncbi:conserved hypothetical protein [Trichinella spiralis]|uniref:hypothetical protein n=1 Tax=Trichinella spiralis TaxID=6334 RepID=UPI0001EFB982|nr:conserved hypothetical protein [Trichinella spiralis]